MAALTPHRRPDRVRGGTIHRLLTLGIDIGALVALVPTDAVAQSIVRGAGIDSRVTVTNNADLTSNGAKRSDAILSVSPNVRLASHGPRLDLDLDASAQLVHYLHGTQPDGILPVLQSHLKTTLAERLLFVEAAGNVRQEEVNPYGARVTEDTTLNRRTSSLWSVSPYLLREFTARTSALLRHDEEWNRSGVSNIEQRSHNTVARVDVKPAPVGFLVELSRLDNAYQGAASSSLTIDAARAGSTFSIDDDTIVGAIVGKERARSSSDQTRTDSDSVFGLSLRWAPGPRTELTAKAEHRFFGSAAELSFRHRTPFTQLVVQFLREPVTASTTMSTAANGANLATYLDAIMSRGVPDAVQRATQVQSRLTTMGLQATVPGGVDIASSYAQLLTGGNILWVVSIPRTTITMSGYEQTVRRLGISASPSVAALSNADTRQSGASVEVSHRLGPQTSLDARAYWSLVRGLAARQGARTEEGSLRLGVVEALSPRTVATTGVQYRVLRTTELANGSLGALSGFVGLGYKF